MKTRIAQFSIGLLGVYLTILFLGLARDVFAQSTVTYVNPAAQFSGLGTDVCVPTSVTTTMPTNPLRGRRGVEIQNNGPNALYCAFLNDPVALTTANPNGRVIPGAGNAAWQLDIASATNLQVKCIAATAAQVASTGCTHVSEIR